MCYNDGTEKIVGVDLNNTEPTTMYKMAQTFTIPKLETKPLTSEMIKKAMAEFNKHFNADEKPDKSSSKETNEEWVWVTGYKGTDKNMKCRDYQYELGKLHQMPEDAEIKDCESGFHLCLNLKDVRTYYEIGNGRRYFEVQALVRKRDVNMYGKEDPNANAGGGRYKLYFDKDPVRDKLAAKSIVFTRELTVDEILKDTEAAEWPEEYKRMAIEEDMIDARRAMQAKELTTLGYSEAFAQYIAQQGSYEDAKKVASQKDLSMDMKVLCIIRGL